MPSLLCPASIIYTMCCPNRPSPLAATALPLPPSLRTQSCIPDNFLFYTPTACTSHLHPTLSSGLWWQSSLYLLPTLSPHSSLIVPITGLSLCSCYNLNKHTHTNTTCIKVKLLLDNCRFPWAGFQCDFLRVLMEPEFLPRPNPPPPQMSRPVGNQRSPRGAAP